MIFVLEFMHFLAFEKKSRNVLHKAVHKYMNINFEILLVFGAFVCTTFVEIKHFLLGMLDKAHLYVDLN